MKPGETDCAGAVEPEGARDAAPLSAVSDFGTGLDPAGTVHSDPRAGENEHGAYDEMRRSFPRRLYRRRALIENVFSPVERKISARAPGRKLRMRVRKAVMLGLSFNPYRLRHRYFFLRMPTGSSYLMNMKSLHAAPTEQNAKRQEAA